MTTVDSTAQVWQSWLDAGTKAIEAGNTELLAAVLRHWSGGELHQVNPFHGHAGSEPGNLLVRAWAQRELTHTMNLPEAVCQDMWQQLRAHGCVWVSHEKKGLLNPMFEWTQSYGRMHDDHGEDLIPRLRRSLRALYEAGMDLNWLWKGQSYMQHLVKEGDFELARALLDVEPGPQGRNRSNACHTLLHSNLWKWRGTQPLEETDRYKACLDWVAAVPVSWWHQQDRTGDPPLDLLASSLSSRHTAMAAIITRRCLDAELPASETPSPRKMRL